MNSLSEMEFSVLKENTVSPEIQKSLIIQDLPDYLTHEIVNLKPQMAVKKVPQYKGYLVDMNQHESIEFLIQKTFSKNSRKNFRTKFRKLERENKITYKFFHGKIEKTHYDFLFDECYHLMKGRFQQKKIHNRYLLNWGYYHALFYPKILKKEASLFVIYDNKKPITMTLNFHKADIVFSFIQIFNINYNKYSMGDIAMYKNLEWCYGNGCKIWDTSKGETTNKVRWSNHTYYFNNHIFFNKNSIVERLMAYGISKKMELKQVLRDRKIIGGMLQLDRLYYYIKMKKIKSYNWKEDH